MFCDDNMCFILQIIHDLDHLAAEVCGNYIGHVFEILNSCSTEVLDLVKHSIVQGGKSLKDLVPSVIDSIIETLVEKSNEVPSNVMKNSLHLIIKISCLILCTHIFRRR